MKCPYCHNEDTQVVDSREAEDGATIRRRRRCLGCEKRFTTYERIELTMPQLVKKDGSRVDFDTAKLQASFKLALRKRNVPIEKVEDAISRIEERLATLGEREVATDVVGELVMRELRKLDKVAFIRFASVYRNFEDPDDFKDVVAEVMPIRRKRY